MQTIELAACPICAADLVPLGVSEKYEIRALSDELTVNFMICRACSFVCQGNVLGWADLMRYYQNSPKLREAHSSDTDRTLYAAQAAFMERAGSLRGRRVLDIGADMGKLLDHLLANYGCLTYYEEENQTAKRWLEETGRHQHGAAAPNIAPFDWIVLSQVLEHIIDPVPMLAGLRKRLAPNGKLFVEVPNHGIWDDLDVGFFFEHVNYFSSASLTAAFDRAGYHLVSLEVTTDAHYFEGRCRIIRACAQPRAVGLIADAAEFVRLHDRKQKLGRVQAVAQLARDLQQPGKPGLALYGAAELAAIVLRHLGNERGSIAALYDSDVRKHGTAFGDLIVSSPSAIGESRAAAILILSSAEADIRRTIESAGFRGRVIPWSEIADG